MASKFIPLEEAAKLLNVPTDKLVQMRSNGELRGFKDGSSWKFPQDEIDRLKDELVNFSGSGSNIIGGEKPTDGGSGAGSDLEIGSEPLSEGSDVALIAGDDDDVQIVANFDSGDDVLGKESADNVLVNSPSGADALSGITPGSDEMLLADESKLGQPSGDDLIVAGSSQDNLDLADNSGQGDVDLSVDLSLGGDTPSDGMDIDLSLADDALSDPNELNLSVAEPSTGGSDLNLSDEPSDSLASGVNLSDSAINPPEISLGADSDGLDLNLQEESDDDIDLSLSSPQGSGNNVLSELDLLSADQGGSGDLIHGDSGSMLGSGSAISGISGIGSAIDNALDDDDDLVISDDDDDLVLGSAGSDVSVVGDSGINLMSPSDSGLSLESEPLDLAGSSISALDLGGEGTDRTPGSGSRGGVGSSGSLVDFKADEEFQLSPSGIGLETDDDSGSQVIEVEDSESFSGAMDLGEGEMLSADAGLAVDPDTGEGRGWAQRNELLADDAVGIDDASLVADPVEEEVVLEAAPTPAPAPTSVGYEVPYSVWNVMSLAGILMMLSFGGMLMTDLVRNLWTFSDTSSPVSSLTEAILNAVGMNG